MNKTNFEQIKEMSVKDFADFIHELCEFSLKGNMNLFALDLGEKVQDNDLYNTKIIEKWLETKSNPYDSRLTDFLQLECNDEF